MINRNKLKLLFIKISDWNIFTLALAINEKSPLTFTGGSSLFFNRKCKLISGILKGDKVCRLTLFYDKNCIKEFMILNTYVSSTFQWHYLRRKKN